MKSALLQRFGAACFGVLLYQSVLLAGELKLPASGATPRELVDAALRTELDGPTAERDALLKQALDQDPDFAPARWQSGFVRWDDQWLTLDQVAQRVRDDKLLAEYRKRRDRMIDTADAHRELAVWCRKHGLQDESRLHWAKVLEFDRFDAEAVSALGLTWYEGRLMSRDQIAAAKTRSRERMRTFYHWRPKLMKWRTAIEDGNAEKRDVALRELGTMNDPGAISALEFVFGTAKGETADRLRMLLVETLDRMPQQQATDALLRRAVYDPSQEVALAAADSLAKRPMHSYVPQLIATMPSQLKSRFHVTVMPGGTVLHEHEIELKTQQGTFSMAYESLVHPTDIAVASVVTPTALARERAKATSIEADVAAGRQARESLRKRIQFVLKRATAFDDAEDPELWIKQYTEYYGWTTPEKSNKVQRQYVWQYQTYFPLPVVKENPRSESSQRNYSSSSSAQSRPPASAPPAARFRAVAEPITGVASYPGECFATGTPVLTIDGPRPIETLKPGDLLLAQDVDTGELAYKTVQNRTLRRSIQLVAIRAGSETIAATPGHPFFVAGKGWRVAKHLQVGDRLCGLSGTSAVEYLGELPRNEVYNLVVSDFNTFFVGNGRLLVHDDRALGPTTALVPGLLADAVAASNAARN